MPDRSPATHPLRTAPRAAALNLILAAVYFGAAKFGLALAVIHPSASAVWPPAGIALAAFLLGGGRVWPGIALGAFLANATTAGSLATSAGIAAGNTLEGFAGAWLVTRFAGGRAALSGAKNVFRFVGLAAGLSTIVSATIGVTSLSLGGYAPWSDYRDIWTTWWLGDAVGDLVVAPALLLWVLGGPPKPPRRLLEATGATLLFAATAAAYFGGIGGRNAPVEWVWIPVVVWIAYRFGARAAATSVLAMAGVTVWGTIRRLGPFALPSPNASLLLLQAFLGVVSVLGLTLAAVVSARQRAFDDLARARDDLENRVRERTSELSRAVESLRAEVDERLRLEKELLDAGERERQRLGRDLHDDLGQLLAGIGFLLGALEKRLTGRPREEISAVTESRGLVQEAVAKTRNLSLGLAPVSLGAGGFPDALRELAATTERVFRVACDLECDPGVVVDSPLAATNLYRVAQEAISNGVRHGRCRRIAVSVSVDAEDLTLSIRDDGVGLSGSAGERYGLGLGIMRHRAEVLGGTLEVTSDEEGTMVTCAVPSVARLVSARPAPES